MSTEQKELEPIFENEVVEPVAEPKPEPVVAETEPAVKAKPVKKKRVLTEEQKERLRNQLKKGRETSLANRKKRAQLKKIDKEEKNKADDEKIFQAMKKKLRPSELERENAELKKQLAEFKKSQQIAKAEPVAVVKPVKVKKVKKIKTAVAEDSDDEIIVIQSSPTIIEDEKPKKKHVAQLAKPAKKELSKREMMRAMRGL